MFVQLFKPALFTYFILCWWGDYLMVEDVVEHLYTFLYHSSINTFNYFNCISKIMFNISKRNITITSMCK